LTRLLKPETTLKDGRFVMAWLHRTQPRNVKRPGNQLQDAIDVTNQCFENSQVMSHRVRLTHHEQVAYAEADTNRFRYPDSIDYDYLVHDGDRVLDELWVMRDLHAADSVIFLNGRSGGKSALKGDWAPVGAGGIGGYTFAHELGHNFGCKHALGDTWTGDPPGTQQTGRPYPFSHGWHLWHEGKRWPRRAAGRRRPVTTIMPLLRATPTTMRSRRRMTAWEPARALLARSPAARAK
jgi:hypothetical protein